MKRISVSIVATLLALAGGTQSFATTIFPALGITDPASKVGVGNQGTTNLQLGYEFTVDSPIAVTDLDVYEAAANATVPKGTVVYVKLFCISACGSGFTQYQTEASATFGSASSAETYPVALIGGVTTTADLYQSINPVKLVPGGEYEIEATGFSTSFKADTYAVNVNNVNYPNDFTGIYNSVTYLTNDGTVTGTSGSPTSGVVVTGHLAAGVEDYEAASFEFSPTPEPGTLLLMGTGVLGLAGMVRRKFRKTAA